MKLKINGYEVEITAHGEGSSDTAATMVLLDSIADACTSACITMRKLQSNILADKYETMAIDIFTALSDAGMYD